jgi:hypothetical protein
MVHCQTVSMLRIVSEDELKILAYAQDTPASLTLANTLDCGSFT